MINQLTLAKHFFVLFLFYGFTTSAQDSTFVSDSVVADSSLWQHGGNFNINLSQVSLSNWAGGGNNAISLGFLVGLFSDYESARSIWKNSFSGAYGIQKQEGLSSRKTDDLLELNSEYSKKLRNPNWLWSSIVNVRTQFAEGISYDDINDTQTLISAFMAPGYLQVSTGVGYTQSNFFTFTFSPITGKLTFVTNELLSQQGVFGLEPGDKLRSELGASLDAKLTRELMENVTLKSSLNLFVGYADLTHVDVNWSALVLMKVNKFITASIATQLIYDHDILVNRARSDQEPNIGRATQFKEVLNIGFAYNFGQKAKK